MKPSPLLAVSPSAISASSRAQQFLLLTVSPITAVPPSAAPCGTAPSWDPLSASGQSCSLGWEASYLCSFQASSSPSCPSVTPTSLTTSSVTVDFAGPSLCRHHRHRADGFYAFIHGHPLLNSLRGLFLYVHHPDDSEHPFCKWKKEGLQTSASHLTIVWFPAVSWCLSTWLHPRKNIWRSTRSLQSWAVTPFFSPFIYTLRNDTVVKVLRDVWLGSSRFGKEDEDNAEERSVLCQWPQRRGIVPLPLHYQVPIVQTPSIKREEFKKINK